MSLTPTRDETIIDDNDGQSEDEEEEFEEEEDIEAVVVVAKNHPVLEPGIENIFEDDARGHLEDILDTMLEKEFTEYQDGLRVTSTQLPQRYLNCRDVVIDWLSEVVEEYDWFGKDSLACAVVYMDRYMSLVPMLHRSKYQLLGCACLLIAGKREEREGILPELQDLKDLTDNTYTVEEINLMELAVLNTLQWDLACTHAKRFLDLMLEYENVGGAVDTDERVPQYAQFFIEVAIKDLGSFESYQPSIVASAALATSRHLLHQSKEWPQELATLIQYSRQEIAPCRNAFLAWYAQLEDDGQ